MTRLTPTAPAPSKTTPPLKTVRAPNRSIAAPTQGNSRAPITKEVVVAPPMSAADHPDAALQFRGIDRRSNRAETPREHSNRETGEDDRPAVPKLTLSVRPATKKRPRIYEQKTGR